MDLSIFDYGNYKDYLNAIFSTEGRGRGLRAKLANYLSCQPSYISQVLNGLSDLSLEHAAAVSHFLNHTAEEQHFFILLVNHARSGSKRLKDYFKKQIDQIIQDRCLVQERVKPKDVLHEKYHALYYSRWYYVAIHVLTSIPSFQTEEAISKRLSLPRDVVKQGLEFLMQCGMVAYESGRYKITATRIHLNNHSPWISRHHINWRQKAIQSVDQPQGQDLHFSSVASLSQQDALEIRRILLKAIEMTEPVVQKSPEEEAFAVCIDFFKLI